MIRRYIPTLPGIPRRLAKPPPKQAARLVQLRKAAGLSQAELAKLVRVSPKTIAFWETSHLPPRSDVLPQLAKALGVRVEDHLRRSARRAAASWPRRQAIARFRASRLALTSSAGPRGEVRRQPHRATKESQLSAFNTPRSSDATVCWPSQRGSLCPDHQSVQRVPDLLRGDGSASSKVKSPRSKSSPTARI